MKWTVLLVLSCALGFGAWVWQEKLPHFIEALGRGHVESRPTTLTESTPRQVYASGVVEGTTRDIELRFELEGRLTHLDVAEGEMVTEGQVLARLDAAVVRGEVERARAKLSLAEAKRQRLLNGSLAETRLVAEAEVAVAEVEASLALIQRSRVSKQWADHIVTESIWDEADHAARRAESQLQLARARSREVAAGARDDEMAMADAEIASAAAELSLAETLLAKARIVAPCDGIVLRTDVEPGSLVGPKSPLPALRMTNVEELRVRAFVEEFDAARIAAGQGAWIATESEPDQRIPATVIHASPAMSSKPLRTDAPGERLDVMMREVLVRVDGENNLILGLPVDVYFDAEIEPQGTSREPSEDAPIQTVHGEGNTL